MIDTGRSSMPRRSCSCIMPNSLGSWLSDKKFKVQAGSMSDKVQADPQRHPRGGLFYEDFVVGILVEHRLTKTVTQMDNMLFSNMTLNPQPLHIDAHYCATETEWKRPLINSLFTLGLMIGISVNDLYARHHHCQSRDDRGEISIALVRGRHFARYQ